MPFQQGTGVERFEVKESRSLMYLPEQSNGVCAVWTERRGLEHSRESQEEPAEDGGAGHVAGGDVGNGSRPSITGMESDSVKKWVSW